MIQKLPKIKIANRCNMVWRYNQGSWLFYCFVWGVLTSHPSINHSSLRMPKFFDRVIKKYSIIDQLSKSAGIAASYLHWSLSCTNYNQLVHTYRSTCKIEFWPAIGCCFPHRRWQSKEDTLSLSFRQSIHKL